MQPCDGTFELGADQRTKAMRSVLLTNAVAPPNLFRTSGSPRDNPINLRKVIERSVYHQCYKTP
jgi:hypothetical protein